MACPFGIMGMLYAGDKWKTEVENGKRKNLKRREGSREK
jgi:hypothetical protein